MKQESTTYGKRELKYITCGGRDKHSQTRETFESSLIFPPFQLVHLPRGGDPLDDGEADDDPGHQQRQGHFDIEAAALCDGAGRVQRLPVPEIGGGRALLALWLHDCTPERGNGNDSKHSCHFGSHIWDLRLPTCSSPVSSDWTVAPRQRILERLEKVEDAPTDDDVVVETHKTTHLNGYTVIGIDGRKHAYNKHKYEMYKKSYF